MKYRVNYETWCGRGGLVFEMHRGIAIRNAAGTARLAVHDVAAAAGVGTRTVNRCEKGDQSRDQLRGMIPSGARR